MTKQEVRAYVKTQILKLTPEELIKGNRAVCDLFFEEFNITNQDIHIYLTKENSHEVDTKNIIRKLLKDHPVTTLITSVCDFSDNTLTHCQFNQYTTFENNVYGIPEPVERLLYNREPDIILVPLLGYDLKGNRVGFGKGFYDRFLLDYPKSFKVGLSLLDPVDEIEDVDKWDIPLDYCINPRGVITF